MKYTYEFRTPDNVRHSGVIGAATKDEAFEVLRARGIKPFCVAEASGFWNHVIGKGKRWATIVVLALALVCAVVVLQSRPPTARSERRSQIYGDPGVLQLCESRQWTNVFSDPFDLLLSRFARPGLPVTDVPSSLAFDPSPLPIAVDDPAEIAKMKRIVNGMKDELRAYLSEGGTVQGYVERLVERQRVECELVDSFNRDFEALRREGVSAAARPRILENWQKMNENLREMGLRTVPYPSSWDLENF